MVFEAAHRFGDTGLTVGGDISHTFGQNLFYLGAPSGSTKSYTVVNAFAQYEPPQVDGLSLRVGVDNLLNELYAESATYGQEFGTIVPLNEPGRTISFKLSYNF